MATMAKSEAQMGTAAVADPKAREFLRKADPEVCRGSKAALNMFMRSFAVRQSDTARAFVLIAPGWVQTALGGSNAPLTIEESVPNLVNVLLAKRERPGLGR